MNINKKLLIFFMMLFLSPLTIYADEQPNLEDEELPAIDPFQGGSGSISQNQEGTGGQTSGGGMLNGLRLIGTMIGENKKLAIFSSPGGTMYTYQELQEIVTGVIITDIFNEYIEVQDIDSNMFEVYMNNIIKPSNG